MTTRLRTKVALASGSALLSAVGLYAVLAARPHRTLETRWVASSPATAPAVPPRPSGFRVRPLNAAERESLLPLGSPLYQFDPATFYRYRAGANFEYPFDEYPGGRIRFATNSMGLRGRDEVRTDPPELRVLVIGDSHTDGVCDPAEAYSAQVQRALRKDGRDAEVLNSGVGGYSFHNYVGALERYLPLAPDVVVVTAYGGNDFQEVLPLQHLFSGTALPETSADYRRLIERAVDIHDGAVGQMFGALRFFAEHPDEIEIALAGAHEATAEIAEQCAAHGVRPLFVYLPPATDVAWKFHAERFERMAQVLELDQEALRRLDGMADRYLDDLRSRGLEVLDLRPPMRAANESPYWSLDMHLSLRGNAIVAHELVPAIERLCPTGFERTADEPHLDQVGASESAPELGKGWKLEIEDEPLAAVTLEPERARALFAWGTGQHFDAHAGFVADGSAELELRDASAWKVEVGDARRRVLIAGDELALGTESLGTLLERSGAFVCRDASTAGHGPFNYLGVLDAHAAAPPQVFVVVWNAGNDFFDALDTLRALYRTPPIEPKEPIGHAAPAQIVARIADKPRETRTAAEAAVRFACELQRRAAAKDAHLVIALVRPNAGLPRSKTREGLGSLDRIATAFAGALREAKISVVDADLAPGLDARPALDRESGRLTQAARELLARAIAAALQP